MPSARPELAPGPVCPACDRRAPVSRAGDGPHRSVRIRLEPPGGSRRALDGRPRLAVEAGDSTGPAHPRILGDPDRAVGGPLDGADGPGQLGGIVAVVGDPGVAHEVRDPEAVGPVLTTLRGTRVLDPDVLGPEDQQRDVDRVGRTTRRGRPPGPAVPALEADVPGGQPEAAVGGRHQLHRVGSAQWDRLDEPGAVEAPCPAVGEDPEVTLRGGSDNGLGERHIIGGAPALPLPGGRVELHDLTGGEGPQASVPAWDHAVDEQRLGRDPDQPGWAKRCPACSSRPTPSSAPPRSASSSATVAATRTSPAVRLQPARDRDIGSSEEAVEPGHAQRGALLGRRADGLADGLEEAGRQHDIRVRGKSSAQRGIAEDGRAAHRDSSSSARSRSARAWWRRHFTVPTGMPRIPAISATGRAST